MIFKLVESRREFKESCCLRLDPPFSTYADIGLVWTCKTA